MNQEEKRELIRRLEKRFGAHEVMRFDGPDHVQEILDRMVGYGASRFGVGVDEPDRAGFRACELAPPLARMIDHTALKPDTTETQIKELCAEARQYCFASVCVSPCFIQLASKLLRGSEVAVCTVVGFPHGASATLVKAREAEVAIRDGATEIDMVINVGMLKSRRYDYVEADIRAVVDVCTAASESGETTVITKVILETALLTNEEKVIASVLSLNAKADFVKTSTGFASGGATTEDISLMRRVVGPDMGIKASGGVRTKEDAETMIAHGATRIGASASVAILKGSS